MSSSSAQATPRPGFHAVSRATGTDMSYSDLAFVTAHPPDIPPRSRIVAVCATDDEDDAASPENDGWFLNTHTSSQVWLTSLEPGYLVDKYGEYAHGDTRKGRRVVLERSLLSQVETAGNMRVVPHNILLERFVKTAEEQAGYARRDDQQLIILIFGHGKEQTGDVVFSSIRDDVILPMDWLQRVLPTGTKVTLVLTSCYSGNWLIQPKLGHRRTLNVTGIVASGPDDETRSWSISRSAGRACGSTIATAILKELIRVEQAADTDEAPQNHPSYVNLAASIYDRARSLDTFFADQNVHFSAQDDDWEAHWRARIGTPLVQFRYRWEMLRKIPPSGADTGGSGASLSNRRLGSLKRDLHKFAAEYFAAKPGRGSSGGNVGLHGSLNQFLHFNNPRYDTIKMVQKMLDKVIFRLNMMKEADEYIKAMGLEFPSCLGYSIEDQPRLDENMQAKRSFAWNCLTHAQLFSSGVPANIPSFHKPWAFLSIALAQKCQTENEIEQRVEKALEWRKVRNYNLLPHVQAYKIMNDSDIRAKLRACFTSLRAVGHQLHVKAEAWTPSHRGYSSVPDDDIPTF